MRTSFALALFLVGCSPKEMPYAYGPVMSKKSIKKTFRPILEFMDVRPGIKFADFGAGSGATTVMMATLMTDPIVFIQDIDTVVLNRGNLGKIISYYSKQSKRNLNDEVKFNIQIGKVSATGLPDAAFDVIYTNATMHVLEDPNAILQDLRTKLKPGGRLFIRDSFEGDHKEGAYCSDKTCAKPLMTIDEFLKLMKSNQFRLVKQSPDMSGYPVFGFESIL